MASLMDKPIRIDRIDELVYPYRFIFRMVSKEASGAFAAEPKLRAVSFWAAWEGELSWATVRYRFVDDSGAGAKNPAFRAEAFRLELRRDDMAVFLRDQVSSFRIDRPVVASLVLSRCGRAIAFEVYTHQPFLDVGMIDLLRAAGITGRSTVHPVFDGEPSGHEILACEDLFRQLFPVPAAQLEAYLAGA